MPGNVQVPSDGQPIILLVEQTIGGYAKIATVITPDLFRIAQAKPGDSVRFSMISLEDAHQVYREWCEFTAGAMALVESP
jgi:allophanate hydrolase subunit 2